MIRRKFDDFTEMMTHFNNRTQIRKARGSKGGTIYIPKDNPKEIVVILEWENLEKAKQFIKAHEENQTIDPKPEMIILEKIKDTPN